MILGMKYIWYLVCLCGGGVCWGWLWVGGGGLVGCLCWCGWCLVVVLDGWCYFVVGLGGVGLGGCWWGVGVGGGVWGVGVGGGVGLGLYMVCYELRG